MLVLICIFLTHECVLLIHHPKYLILHTQIYGLLQIVEIPAERGETALGMFSS
jgi:hypothetical protein